MGTFTWKLPNGAVGVLCEVLDKQTPGLLGQFEQAEADEAEAGGDECSHAPPLEWEITL